jgi:hypothetical protein
METLDIAARNSNDPNTFPLACDDTSKGIGKRIKAGREEAELTRMGDPRDNLWLPRSLCGKAEFYNTIPFPILA